jgi:sec-independent protein translocase protein TatC
MPDDPEPSDSSSTDEVGSSEAEDAATPSDTTGSSSDPDGEPPVDDGAGPDDATSGAEADDPDADGESGAAVETPGASDGSDDDPGSTGEIGDTADADPVTESTGSDADGRNADDSAASDEESDGDSSDDGEEPAGEESSEGTDGEPDGGSSPPPGTADGGVNTVGTEPDAVPYGDTPVVGGDGPAEDVEMPLADHIEEMIRRVGIVLVVASVVALAVFPVADQVINYLWNSHIPGAETIVDRRPRLYGPLELIMTKLKVSFLAGLLLGLPVFVYETYRFMRPGLYPQERRYYLAAVPTSLVLALVGVAFAHFVVLPAIFAYFTAYTTGTAVVAFGLKETFNLILVLMGYMAVVFQIPLFIQLGIMMNLVTRAWLEDRRLLFWGGFAGLAFLVSPDPTGMAPIIVAATMIVLFEGTLALLRWTGH